MSTQFQGPGQNDGSGSITKPPSLEHNLLEPGQNDGSGSIPKPPSLDRNLLVYQIYRLIHDGLAMILGVMAVLEICSLVEAADRKAVNYQRADDISHGDATVLAKLATALRQIELLVQSPNFVKFNSDWIYGPMKFLIVIGCAIDVLVEKYVLNRKHGRVTLVLHHGFFCFCLATVEYTGSCYIYFYLGCVAEVYSVVWTFWSVFRKLFLQSSRSRQTYIPVSEAVVHAVCILVICFLRVPSLVFATVRAWGNANNAVVKPICCAMPILFICACDATWVLRDHMPRLVKHIQRTRNTEEFSAVSHSAGS
jgi:hypothetical protein